MTYRFEAEVWRYEGAAAWHFLTVPEDVSDDIDARTRQHRAGFGSVRVEVTIGATTWATSVFPDRKRGAYLLPVKQDVRRREEIDAGDTVSVELRVVV